MVQRGRRRDVSGGATVMEAETMTGGGRGKTPLAWIPGAPTVARVMTVDLGARGLRGSHPQGSHHEVVVAPFR